MGYSRRKEQAEIAGEISASNKCIEGVTFGQLCARGLMQLEVRCHQCKRKGSYSLLRLIEKRGAMLPLTELADILSADCQNRQGADTFYRKCGVYFPDVK